MDKNIESNNSNNLETKTSNEFDSRKLLEEFEKKMSGWIYQPDNTNPFISNNKSGFSEFLADIIIACCHNYYYDKFRADNISLENIKTKYVLAIKNENKVEIPLKDGLLKIYLNEKSNELKIDFYNLQKELSCSNSFYVNLQTKPSLENTTSKELSYHSLDNGKVEINLKDGNLKLNIDEKNHSIKTEFINTKNDVFLSENCKFDDPLKVSSSWDKKINDKSNDFER